MTQSRSPIEQIAAQAAEIDSLEARAAFLDVACAGDTAMRGAVESVVARLDAERVTMAGPLAPVRTNLGFTKGDHVGRYRLIGRLGEGGFGVVWRAEQTEPVRREVALKLIKPGMDSAAVLARFEAERQALAVMDHPCIARVLDGGATERGLPYFVMELVRGMPISDFCDTHKLSIAERIGLFIQVCEAVQHAHMKGVIHRDLKPSNILVAYGAVGDPRPKVIDFGIAKALNQRLAEATIFTEQGQMIGTPEYMSPEQAEMSGLDIDTRSDVYSLGVMLYELLTGSLPFDPRTLRAAGYAEIQRIIREVDPPRPSTRLGSVGDEEGTRIITARKSDLRELSTTLKRDLDWIVMRCLEKERSRRYDAASDIADELRRYLNHEPVQAGPPSAVYRARKFVRRNRAGVMAGSLIALALVAAVIGTTWGMLWALSERDRAEEAETTAEARAAQLELVSSFQASQLSEVNAAAMGEGLRDGLLRQASDTLRLGGVPDDEITERIAGLREQLHHANFTTLALEALEAEIFDRALQAIERDFADQPVLKATLLQTIASTLRAVGLMPQALPPQMEAMALRRAHLGDMHPDTIYSIGRAGALLGFLDEPEQAEQLLREEFEGSRQVLGPEHPLTLGSLNNLASAIGDQGRHAEALELLQDVLAQERRVLGNSDSKTINTMDGVADTLRRLGRIEEAGELYREAMVCSQQAFGDDHPITIGKRGALARHLIRGGELQEAEEILLPAVDSAHRVLGDLHWSTIEQVYTLGVLRRAQKRPAEAAVQFRTAWERSCETKGSASPAALDALHALLTIRLAQGEFAEAEVLCMRFHDTVNTPYSIELLVGLYSSWHAAEPDAGHEAQAAAWRAKLPPDGPEVDPGE